MADTKARSLSTLVQAGAVPALETKSPAEVKKELIDNGTEFTITDVKYAVDGEFDPFWQLTIQVDGSEETINLGSGAYRDDLMEQLSAAVGEAPISGVKLKSVATKKGHPFVTIVAAE